jgi:aspartate carbamoyltransferase catalytic subunit
LAADFQRQVQAMSRKKGEVLFDGWQIVSIAYPEVVVSRRATSKKDHDGCKRVSIGSSIESAPNC